MPLRQAAFELKGAMAPLTVMRLYTVDLMQIERQLRAKIAQRPQMFLYAPVLLDLANLEDGGTLAVAALISLMRAFKLVPIGAIHAPDTLGPAFAGTGLGILPSAAAKPRTAENEAAPADARTPIPGASAAPAPTPAAARPTPVAARPAPAPSPSAAVTPAPTPRPIPAAPVMPPVRAGHGGPMVVSSPVRSGQVIYAQNCDLVVLAPVNPGAQVMADGHVHIYSTLRGRAIAGAQGLSGARVFVQKLEAELVAIGDAYVLADELPANLRGRPAQVFLEGNECRIEPL